MRTNVSQISSSDSGDVPPYLNPKLPIEERINDLLPRMTLEEKAKELIDSWGSPGIPRLKIPALLKTEGLHGQSYSTGAAIFPMPIEMASTFDLPLIHQVGVATAVEAKAANLRATWSPVLDVARDARWGRVEETYGEDPYLVSRMGVSWIEGFQSQDMIAIPKHFAGHGEPLGGRDSHDVGLSERVLRETHLVSFRAAVEEAHAGGVMAAYSTWDATPDNASKELLQTILRQEWGFDGVVVSDCGGVENLLTKQFVVTNLEEACQRAILAGVDINCGSAYQKALVSAVHDGLLKENDLDPNVRAVLRAKFRLGLFENPGPQKMAWDKLPEYDTPEHRALTRKVATEGIVLLKNESHLLPLSKDIKTIAVIGPDADVAQTGDYSAKPAPNQLVTVLQAVKSHVSPDTKVLYARGCDVLQKDTSGFTEAVDTAKQADVVILVVGDNSGGIKEKSTTGENNDGATLEIPGVQPELIKAIQATGKPIVLVLVNGKPFVLDWEAEHIPAILETWYPGEEGGNATADIIFGDSNPSGKLPITFPRNVGQLPLRYDYFPSGRRYNYYDMPFSPLYRFGFGLSYTTFKYSNLHVTQDPNDPGLVTISVEIKNTGDRDGDEVAQLYITDMLTSVITPVMELKGFHRVSLKKGETKTVTFKLTPYQLSFLDAGMNRVVEPAEFRVHVGDVSPEAFDGDGQKSKIGFTAPSQGVSGKFSIEKNYAAHFEYGLSLPAKVRGGEPIQMTVTITNTGNLLDVAKLKLYGADLLDSHHFEIAPGQTRVYNFKTTLYQSGDHNITAILGQQAITRTIRVSKSPAKLELKNIQTSIGDDGVLHYTADAANVGGRPYKEALQIRVNSKVAASQPLALPAGGHRSIKLDYAFPRSGRFRVQIGDTAEQEMVVPGGVTLALQNPLIYLDFNITNAQHALNKINGSVLPIKGTPQFVSGKDGWAFSTDNKNTFIEAGGVDLYRKPFTLAAWVNVEQLEDRQAMFFGGQAPMGADVGTTGTGLAAGVLRGAPLLSFWDRDVHTRTRMPVGQWVHVAYTYDPDLQKGSIYLNGKLVTTASQQPYAGPLDMIGGAERFNHGKFAIDDVLVCGSCLQPDAIAVMANHGVKALENGQITTGWKSMKSAPKSMETWSEIPDGSQIKVVVESGDMQGNVLDSKTVELKTGKQDISLTGLKSGKQVRLAVQLTGGNWGAAPELQTVELSGNGNPVRWSTSAEWATGVHSGGLEIGK